MVKCKNLVLSGSQISSEPSNRQKEARVLKFSVQSQSFSDVFFNAHTFEGQWLRWTGALRPNHSTFKWIQLSFLFLQEISLI